MIILGYEEKTDNFIEIHTNDMNTRIKWAKDFQKNPNCNSCPLVLDEVDNGVGIQRHCNHVCKMEIGEILEEMEGAGV